MPDPSSRVGAPVSSGAWGRAGACGGAGPREGPCRLEARTASRGRASLQSPRSARADKATAHYLDNLGSASLAQQLPVAFN
ncbi:hypothetical protein Salmuc_01090 [Salipiger mucosus DSM 16094]|uniref:Uncharacterized protein n=1 Tax=Salipiger mucosus DSM 16094 TaxID=1123237 RepID=S9SFU6_9RHOB|nr:hypothetical protein Salmuc_01090 [Salipiger mucosus DSM 16094]